MGNVIHAEDKFGHGHGPTLESMVVGSLKTAVDAGSEAASAIDHTHVVMHKEQPDIGATIEHMRADARGALGKLKLDSEDPEAVPGYETLQRLLSNYDKLIEKGHMRSEPKTEIAQAFRQQVAERYIRREVTRIAAAKPDQAKNTVETLAQYMGMYNTMRTQINNAKTSAELSQIAQPVLQRIYQEMQQYRSQKGTLQGFNPAPTYQKAA